MGRYIDLGEGSGYIEPGNGSLWIHGMKSVYRFDLKSRQAESRFKSTSRVLPIVYDSESVWIAFQYAIELRELRVKHR